MEPDHEIKTHNETQKEREDNVPKIRHIILSGGGGTGFAFYGALRDSHKDGFWNIEDIQTMHGVSIGTIFILLILFLKHFSWEDLDDYCIKRPWEQLLDFSPERILSSYKNLGICNKNTIIETIAPILRAVDLPLNVTMQELYDFTQIEVHFYTTRLNSLEYVDVSYKTHPGWTVVDAIHASSSLPLFFCPSVIDGEVYVDGGIICNYPLQKCIDRGISPEEIFGLKKKHESEFMDATIKYETQIPYENIVDYLLDILNKVNNKIYKDPNSIYTIEFLDKVTSIWETYNIVKTKETRQIKIQQGVDLWQEFKTKIGWGPPPNDVNVQT